ncbi:MAG: hypothetical protein AAGA57_02130 [Planctomycetota bacterium]
MSADAPSAAAVQEGLATDRAAKRDAGRAMALLAEHKLADALDLLRPWMDVRAPLTPGRGAAALLAARALVDAGDADGGLACAMSVCQAWERDPAQALRRADALVALGDLHLRLGDWRRAARTYRRAGVLSPLLPGAWAGLAAAAIQLGRDKLESAALRRLSRVAPGREAATHLARRVTAGASAAAQQAVAKAQQVDALDPKAGAEAWRELARRAAHGLQERAETRGAHADLWRRLADCRQAAGELPASVVACDQALRLNPHYRDAQALRRRLVA